MNVSSQKKDNQMEQKKEVIAQRLSLLRHEMKQEGIDIYLVFSEDDHGSEYVGDYYKCRSYLSGFTGSAGTLLITPNSSFLWTDGRYWIQAKEQLDGTEYKLMCQGAPDTDTITEFLEKIVTKNTVVGMDGTTISVQQYDTLNQVIEKRGGVCKVAVDLVGNIWKERPKRVANPIWELAADYAGKTRLEKLIDVRAEMEKDGVDAYLISSLEDIAWLLNLRGNDIAYTPVFLAYLLVEKKRCVLFVQEGVVSETQKEQLKSDSIDIALYESVSEILKCLPERSKLHLCKAHTSVSIKNCVESRLEIHWGKEYTQLPKAIKNETECMNMRQAHIKDGIAFCRFWRWLENEIEEKRVVTELGAAEKLLQFRQMGRGFVEESFEPIIAYGAHGAIVHYSATDETDAVLKPQGLLLMDTGGHYLEGTTDITRTIALGEPTERMKQCFTAVLKGNLRLGHARFFEKTKGSNLDILAREALWQLGLDYRHGTGHGVGYLLSVHEGPVGIRSLVESTDVPALMPGMILSNEPGYYEEGEFGIRLENLILCKEVMTNEYGTQLGFETLTVVPFDKKAIDASLLSEEERLHLNEYHHFVYETLKDEMDENEASWLLEKTEPI